MLTTNNGFVPAQFTEETANFKGDKLRAPRNMTAATVNRLNYSRKIKGAKKDRDAILTNILIKNSGALANFVIQKGEVPAKNPVGLAFQAALLRAKDIVTIAKAIDTDDADALQAIESAEQEAKDINSADKNPLPVEVQAALSLTLDYLKKKNKSDGGEGNLRSILAAIEKINFNNAFAEPDHEPIGSKSPGGTNLGNVSEPDNFDLGAIFGPATPQTIPGATTTTNNNTSSGGGNWLDSIFGVVDKVLTGVGKITNQVNNTANQLGSTATNVLSQVKNTASDIGSESINKSLQKYLPIILGGVLAIVVIIIIIIYASKRK